MTQDNWNDRDIAVSFFRTVRTIFLWVVWMMFTIFWGVDKDMGFFDNPHVPLWAHIVFFAWVAVTFPLMIWITMKKIWHK